MYIYVYMYIYIYVYIYISFLSIFPVPNSCQQSFKAPLWLPVEGLTDEELFGLPAKENGLGGFGG